MKYSVVVTTPRWHMSGVNTFTASLARGLARHGVKTHVVITRASSSPRQVEMETREDLDVHVLDPPHNVTWRDRWHALTRFVASVQPCVYLPNYDFNIGLSVAWMNDRVRAVSIIHSDEAQYYRFVARTREQLDAVVGVSRATVATAEEILEPARPRVATHHIPYGVPHTSLRRVARAPGAPLRIAYVGRLHERQKRTTDLALIARELRERGIRFVMRIAGDGEDRSALDRLVAELGLASEVEFLGLLSPDKVSQLLSQSDVLMLPSRYEGLPLVLLEAMEQGVVPIVSDIRSGIPDLVGHGLNGFRVAVGDIRGFVAAAAALAHDNRLLEALSRAAKQLIAGGPYEESAMVDAYHSLFQKLLSTPRLRRPRAASYPVLPGWLNPHMPLSTPYPIYRAVLHSAAIARGLGRNLLPSSGRPQ